MNARINPSYLAAFAVTLAASIASAQVAPNYSQNGHLLDRNPQVGGGGSNSPVQGYVPASGNDIITGNVTGLARFHGNVPYRSTLDSGSVGNSSVSNFNRTSAGTPYSGTYTGVNTTWYNPSLVVATPGVNPSQLRDPAISSGVSSSIVRDGRYQSAGSQLQLQPSGSAGQVMRDNRYNPDPSVNPFDPGASVSPLFGLQQDLRADAPQNQYQYPQPKPTPPPANNTLTPSTRPGIDDTIRTDLGVNAQSDAMVNGQPTNVRVDERVRGAAGSELVGQTNKNLIVSDEYRDLLVQLQKSSEAEQAKLAAAAANSGKPKPATGPEFVIDPYTGSLRVRGPEEKDAAGAATRPGIRGKDQTRDATSALKAARTMPPLDTLAGRGATPFNQIMAGAEMRLKNGKYFEAADLYQQAMNMEPTNMLPVIGRAHAELGGGMYESAAYDLKFMFERKPEMMGLRYNLRTLIPQERLDFLAKDLKALAAEKQAETAWFLLSYLQYQQNDPQSLDASLNTWALAMPKDAWPKAMRKAWLDAPAETPKPDTKPDAQPKPAAMPGQELK